jgi:hypothetical protein
MKLPATTFAAAGHNARVDGCFARCDCGWLASRATYRRAVGAAAAHVKQEREPDPRECRRCGDAMPVEAHDFDLCTPCVFTLST